MSGGAAAIITMQRNRRRAEEHESGLRLAQVLFRKGIISQREFKFVDRPKFFLGYKKNWCGEIKR